MSKKGQASDRERKLRETFSPSDSQEMSHTVTLLNL